MPAEDLLKIELCLASPSSYSFFFVFPLLKIQRVCHPHSSALPGLPHISGESRHWVKRNNCYQPEWLYSAWSSDLAPLLPSGIHWRISKNCTTRLHCAYNSRISYAENLLSAGLPLCLRWEAHNKISLEAGHDSRVRRECTSYPRYFVYDVTMTVSLPNIQTARYSVFNMKVQREQV